ncbi:MAG: amidohydrolase family protein [Robiginitalea sp.]
MRLQNFVFKCLPAILLLISACSKPEKQTATLLIYGGPIYTVDTAQTTVEAVATLDSIILFAGRLAEAEAFQGEETRVIDLQGRTMNPGLIEGHCHFMGLGYNELNLDLMNTTSYQEIVDAVAEKVKTTEPGEWITGRGWHQSKWDSMPAETVKGFQTHDLLSEVSPENPVYLSHASGHAGFANAKAMEISGIQILSREGESSYEIEGGEVIRDDLGRPTGIFNERAQTLITRNIPGNTPERNAMAFELAVEACHRNGITGFHDAGIGRGTIALYESMKQSDKMDIRIYAMLTGWDKELLSEWYEKGPYVDPDHRMTIRSVKLNCDGALGSRGAWLLEAYTDRPGHFGHETLPMDFVKETALNGLQHGFQVFAGSGRRPPVPNRTRSAFASGGHSPFCRASGNPGHAGHTPVF